MRDAAIRSRATFMIAKRILNCAEHELAGMHRSGNFFARSGGILCAQQVNPRVPPPPPPADPPAAPANTPAEPASSPTHAAPPPAAPAQPIDPTVPPPPPREEDSADTPAAPSGPVFELLHARSEAWMSANSISTKVFMTRPSTGLSSRPTISRDWRRRGGIWERRTKKKHEYAKAVEAYNKHLNILPHAADAERIRKTVSELQEKTAQDSPKKAEP